MANTKHRRYTRGEGRFRWEVALIEVLLYAKPVLDARGTVVTLTRSHHQATAILTAGRKLIDTYQVRSF